MSPLSFLIELVASVFPLGKVLKVCWLCWSSWRTDFWFYWFSLLFSVLCFTYQLEFHYFLLSTDFELGLLFFSWFLTVLILLVRDFSSFKNVDVCSYVFPFRHIASCTSHKLICCVFIFKNFHLLQNFISGLYRWAWFEVGTHPTPVFQYFKSAFCSPLSAQLLCSM